MPAGAHRLSRLTEVVVLLRASHIPFAVTGAAALAVHGVSRATGDRDVLVVDRTASGPPRGRRWASAVSRRRSGWVRPTTRWPQLLDAGDRAALTAQVEAALDELPEDARRLWARVVDSR